MTSDTKALTQLSLVLLYFIVTNLDYCVIFFDTIVVTTLLNDTKVLTTLKKPLQTLIPLKRLFNLKVKEDSFQKNSQLTQQLFNFSEKYLHVFDLNVIIVKKCIFEEGI